MTSNATHAFCRSCGGGIDAGAKFCGACGAPGDISTTAPVAVSGSYGSYAEVPWFRQRWFAVVCLFFLTPALLFLLATGDIYWEEKGKVRAIGKTGKSVLMALSALAIVRVVAAFF